MFVVEVGAVLTLYTAIKSPSVFNWTIVAWLWLTVVFANLAEAVAEGRGKAQADTLRRAKRETMARRLLSWQPGASPAAYYSKAPQNLVTLVALLVALIPTTIGALLSAIGIAGCDPGFSAASNLGPDNPVLVQLITQRQKAIAAFDHVPVSQIPPDAVTASASGLDPDISPQNAAIQVNRVAAARHLPVSVVKALVARYTQGRMLGFLGEPAVNVLELNIALDQLPARSGG